jgi:HEPN domain-containing protein
MRGEARRWIRQAREDASTAPADIRAGRYYAAVFWCHQAVEKALKGVLIEVTSSYAPKTHDLRALAKASGLPRRFRVFIQRLNPHYIVTRYPDAPPPQGQPLYRRKTAVETLQKTRQVIEWAENRR